jgi:hypothetical protein
VAAQRTRGRDFPCHPKLEELLSTFDPAIGPFQLEMFRRNARDLRKWLCGPEAIGDVPRGTGLRGIILPRGWELLLFYRAPPGPREPGKVTAFFRVPWREEGSQEEPAAEPTLESQDQLPAEALP